MCLHSQILPTLLRQFDDAGFKIVIGAEIEFYLDNADLLYGYIDIQPERGKNQYEIIIKPTHNIANFINDISCAKQKIANLTNHTAIFAPKPFSDDYGNGLHFHINLITSNNTNYFDNDDNIYGVCRALCSDMLKTFLIFANTQEEISRFHHKFMAPTHVCFGDNNRSVAIRIPDQEPRRIEHRLANPQTNIYLALFVILKGIYRHIEQQLERQSHVNTEEYQQRHSKFTKIHGNAHDPQYNLTPLPTSLEIIYQLFDSKFFTH